MPYKKLRLQFSVPDDLSLFHVCKSHQKNYAVTHSELLEIQNPISSYSKDAVLPLASQYF